MAVAFAWVAGTVAWTLGLGLRLSTYDEEGWLLAFRYATPWPVLSATGLTLAIGWLWSGWLGRKVSKAVALGCLLVSLLCLGAWVQGSLRWHGLDPTLTPIPGATRRVVFWNAAGPQGDAVGRAADYLRVQGADLIGLNERGVGRADSEERWRRAFPDHAVVLLPDEMALVVAGSLVGPTVAHSLNGAGRCHECRVRLRADAQEWLVLLVDLDADLTRSRRPAFEALRKLAESRTGERLVLMGDFNTPHDSPHFRLLEPAGLRDAFVTAGRGWSETWPVPVPVLGLDHVLFNSGLRPARARHGWSLRSDHRAVLVDVVEGTLPPGNRLLEHQ